MQSPAPGPSEAGGSAVRCSRCGSDVPPATKCERCGCFLPGNEANLRHGLRRYQSNGTLPAELASDIEVFRDQLIADQGGDGEMTAIRAGTVGKLVDLEVGCRLLMAEVVRRKIDSKPGKAAYGMLLNSLHRWHRFALSLGMNRRTHRVPSLAEVMTADQGAEHRPGESPRRCRRARADDVGDSPSSREGAQSR